MVKRKIKGKQLIQVMGMERRNLGIIVKKGLSEEGTFEQMPGERERSK